MRVLLIDVNNTLYRSAAVARDLTYEGTFTGGIYGFINQITKHVVDNRIDHVVLCEDVPPYWRLEKYPGYKGDRKKEAPTDGSVPLYELHKESKNLLDELCSVVKFQRLAIKGFEADDMIAWFVRTHAEKCQAIYALSNDSDLYQLFDCPNFWMYSTSMKSFFNRKTFDEQHVIPPDAWPLLLSITGTHNNVPGFRGYAEKTATKLLQNTAKWEAFYKENKTLVDRNLDLIFLPPDCLDEHGDCPPPEKAWMKSERSFQTFATKYGISLHAKTLDALSRVTFVGGGLIGG